MISHSARTLLIGEKRTRMDLVSYHHRILNTASISDTLDSFTFIQDSTLLQNINPVQCYKIFVIYNESLSVIYHLQFYVKMSFKL